MSSPGSAPWESLARSAARRGEEAEGKPPRQLLCFSLAGDPYAMRVEWVREIVRMRPIAPVPHVPEAVRGVISLRGEILQVVDLRRRLGVPVAEPSRTSRIVVVEVPEGRVAGLLVDAVTEVLRVSEEDLREAGASDAGAVEALCARGDRFVSLVDLERILELDGDG